MIEKTRKFYRKYFKLAASVYGSTVAFIPDFILASIPLMCIKSAEYKIIIIKLSLLIVATLAIYVYYNNLKEKSIKEKNYEIVIKYGDLFNEKNCKRVIAFDECFTLTVGDEYPYEIRTTSICGKYLQNNKITEEEMHTLIEKAGLTLLRSKSKFQGKVRYRSGSLVPRGDDLLLAFTKLDKDGRSEMTKEEYIDSLFTLWKEINKHHAQKDVCISILGFGTTQIKDEKLTQQELLDIIILTYKLSTEKIKLPNKLRIMMILKFTYP